VAREYWKQKSWPFTKHLSGHLQWNNYNILCFYGQHLEDPDFSLFCCRRGQYRKYWVTPKDASFILDMIREGRREVNEYSTSLLSLTHPELQYIYSSSVLGGLTGLRGMAHWKLLTQYRSTVSIVTFGHICIVQYQINIWFFCV
jgi:hypothetical protein